jgi:hypothetical protein
MSVFHDELDAAIAIAPATYIRVYIVRYINVFHGELDAARATAPATCIRVCKLDI